jgi:hypothetical protein
MPSDEWVYIQVEEIEAETDKALLCRVEGRKEWIPKSQISPEDVDQYQKGDRDVEIPVTSWIAEQKGLG